MGPTPEGPTPLVCVGLPFLNGLRGMVTAPRRWKGFLRDLEPFQGFRPRGRASRPRLRQAVAKPLFQELKSATFEQ